MEQTNLRESALGENTESNRVSNRNACISMKRMERGRWRPGDVATPRRAERRKRDSHQQAGLAAGTVADDDQLSAELGGHGCGWGLELCDGGCRVDLAMEDAAAGWAASEAWDSKRIEGRRE